MHNKLRHTWIIKKHTAQDNSRETEMGEHMTSS